ncbi:AAA family ATPase [Mesorhizobium sp. NPDC059054]|uniref:AAA family ATPase n=1 Tax=Mesorhizobium sp. NPDC059054 TaxID=3346711 RepID=UPI0036A625D0
MKTFVTRRTPRRAIQPVDFLAYCSMMRGVRYHYAFWNNGPFILGVVVPEPQDIEFYSEAVMKVRHRSPDPDPSMTLDDIRIETVQVQPSKSKRQFDLLGAAAQYEKVVVLAASRDSLPVGIEHMADAIIELEPPSMRHVRATARFLFKQQISDEQAARITTFPLSVIAAGWRKGRSPTKAIELMTSTERPKKNPPSGPTLDDLSGLGEAAIWGKELARDLADWRHDRISWNDVDRGVLVSGPPGCGKTMFAQALARTCSVPFFAESLAQWQAMGHLGDLLKAMRTAFDKAKRSAPSILFIDEIDAVGNRAKFTGTSAHYATEVVNGLLECLDGAGGRDGVVVVGATNLPEDLDPALTRPGRLDRHIRMLPPDRESRIGILKHHLNGAFEDSDLVEVAERSAGWTGAKLEQLVRDARRRARRARRPVAAADLTDCLPQRVPLPEPMRWRIAVHEAGHVIVSHVLAVDQIREVSITDMTEVDRETLQNAGGVSFKSVSIPERTKSYFLDRIALNLGGMAAEELVLGERSAGGGGTLGSDIHQATARALQMEASLGLGESLAYLSGADQDTLSLLHLNSELRRRVDAVLREQFYRAKGIISNHQRALDNIARELLRRRKLSGSEVQEVLSGLALSAPQETTTA